MERKSLDKESFSLRDEEIIIFFDKKTPDTKLAIMLRTVFFPPGEIAPPDNNDPPIENIAIIGATLSKHGWKWCSFSQPTKQFIGEILFDNGAFRDKWYYAEIK